jgi:hypothetical protein
MAAGAADWVWANSRAANGPLIVLLAIADELDAKEECVMSYAELARKTRLSDRAVRNGVAELERLGELETAARGNGRGHRAAYRLPLKVAESATFKPETRQNLPPLRPGKVADSATFREPNPAESATFNGHLESQPQVNGTNLAESATFEISNVLKSSSTGSKRAEVRDVPAKPPRADADRLCEHLASRIEANGCRRPKITQKWRDAARLLIDKDGMTEQQAHAAIDWCQDDEFWRANILSMPKLREKIDQLRMQAMRKPRRNEGDRKIGIIAGFIERAANE